MSLVEATAEITVKAVITRADGTVEDQGTIYHWQKGDSRPPSRGVVAMLDKFWSTVKGKTP